MRTYDCELTNEQLLSHPYIASIEDTEGGAVRLHMKNGKMITCPTYTAAVAWLSGYATAMDEVFAGIERACIASASRVAWLSGYATAMDDILLWDEEVGHAHV